MSLEKLILEREEESMILKTLTHDRGNSDCWNYYSGVRAASVFYNEELKMPCVAISGDAIEGEIMVGIVGPAYLCDDHGQTIEKVGPIHEKPYSKKFEG